MDQSWFTCGEHTGPLRGHRDDAVAWVSSRALPGFLPVLPPETRPWPVSKAGILGWICLSWFVKSPCSLCWSDLVNREFYEHQGFNPLRLIKPSTSLWTCQIRGHRGFFSVKSFCFFFCFFTVNNSRCWSICVFVYTCITDLRIPWRSPQSYGSSSEVVCVQAYGWPHGWPHHLGDQLSAASDMITSSTRGNLWVWEKQLYTPGWLFSVGRPSARLRVGVGKN